MNEKGHLIFVYGTLRRGASNAFRLEEGDFVREGVVRGGLYRIGWYPGFVIDAKGGEVIGDLWRVSSRMLRELDEFEGIPEGAEEGVEYRRVRVQVACPVTGGVIEAWVWEWVGAVDDRTRIAHGDWIQPE